MPTSSNQEDHAGDRWFAAPTLNDIEDAARALKGIAVKTPLLENAEVNGDLGCRSLDAGERLANPKGRTTICDAIMTDMSGKLTFSINRQRLAGVLTVSDDEVRTAMKFAFDRFKIVIEPGAAVGLAAVLSQKIDIKGKCIAVIATGGNIDAANFCATLKKTEKPT